MLSAAVADTHAVVFHAAGGRHLGTRATKIFAAAERRTTIVYVPAAVIWECSILARIRRVDFGRPVREFFGDLFSNPAYQPLDLTAEQVLLADEMRPNSDPFDGLICAAARHLSLPLLTRDAAIANSGFVRTVW